MFHHLKTTGLTTVVMAVVIGPFSQLALAEPPLSLAPLGPPPIPLDNKQSEAKIELGKLLFFDPRLGGDGTAPCASCHLPSEQ